MAWKNVKGHNYYYTSERVGSRVRSVYRGKGEVAALMAESERILRQERERVAESDRAEGARLEAEDRAAAAIFEAVDLVVALALEAAGLHRHKGQWRRSKKMTTQATPVHAPAIDVPAVTPTHRTIGPAPKQKPPWPVPREEIIDVLKRVERGDETALPRLRELFKICPVLLVNVAGGDLAGRIEQQMIANMGLRDPKNLLWREALPRKMETMREELAGPDPSPVAWLLAERVVLCWFDVHVRDLNHATDGTTTLAQAAFHQKARDRAHRRYLSALRALASVQRMGPLAAVQLTVQALQVNLSEAAPG